MKKISFFAVALFLLVTAAHAQPWRLPGGGAISWTPASPTSGGNSPTHWYKADGTNYQDSAGTTPARADGDVVGLLTDYGPVVSGVSQPTTDNKPVLKLNVKNGKPAWLFDGSNDWLQGPFASAITQPFNIFVVTQLDPTKIADGVYYILMDGDDALNRASLRKDNTNKFAIYTGAANIPSANAADGNFNIWTVLPNGATSQFWINGISQATGNSGANSIDGLTVGGSNAKANVWKGYICEIIIYGSNLSSADKNQTNAYLAAKYDIGYTAIP